MTLAARSLLLYVIYWILHCLWNEGDQREPGLRGQNATKCSTTNLGINKTPANALVYSATTVSNATRPLR